MSKKILVIEDNDQDRKIIGRYLKKSGYENVDFAESGEEGVTKAKAGSPDIVVSDTMLPGIDGFEVCRQIREHFGPDTPKIIIMTGAVDAVDAVKAKQMGADDYCVKTSDYAPLMEALQNLVSEEK